MRGEEAEEDQGTASDSPTSGGERQLLIDSDAFTLLAATGLLERAIEHLGFVRDEARRLQPLPHMLRKGKFAKHKFTPAEAQAIEQWCDRIAPLRESPPADHLQVLTGIAGIDPGEAALFAWCRHNRSAIMLTGDKTALLAVSKKAPKFCKKLRGRIACLEQVLSAMVAENGVATVFSAVSARVEHHKTLTVCFSEVNRADQAQCQIALQDYVARLEGSLPERSLYQFP